MVNEGLAMLGEGVHPMSVERAATQAGYPVGTLQLSDELNMELMAKIRKATKAAVERDGGTYTPHPAERVIDAMIEAGRPGRSSSGAGFYEYDDGGRRAGLWPGLAELFPPADEQADIADLKDRYAVHRGDRDREVLRGGRHRVVRRGQHRLDHGHRLPGADRWCRAVHAGLRGTPPATASPASWPAPTSSPTKYGERFRPPRTSPSWPRRASGFPA